MPQYTLRSGTISRRAVFAAMALHVLQEMTFRSLEIEKMFLPKEKCTKPDIDLRLACYAKSESENNCSG